MLEYEFTPLEKSMETGHFQSALEESFRAFGFSENSLNLDEYGTFTFVKKLKKRKDEFTTKSSCQSDIQNEIKEIL